MWKLDFLTYHDRGILTQCLNQTRIKNNLDSIEWRHKVSCALEASISIIFYSHHYTNVKACPCPIQLYNCSISYMCVFVCARARVRARVLVCARVRVCAHARVRVCVRVVACTCMRAHMCVCIYVWYWVSGLIKLRNVVFCASFRV